MDKDEVIKLVRQYKQVISSRFDDTMQVYLFGSYSKDNSRPDSDIDVAVVVPQLKDNWLSVSQALWHDVRKVSRLIEPVLIEQNHPSPLYDDILKTGIKI